MTAQQYLESVAICRVFEELHRSRRDGNGLQGQGQSSRLWNTANGASFPECLHVANAFPHTHPADDRNWEVHRSLRNGADSTVPSTGFSGDAGSGLAGPRIIAGDSLHHLADITGMIAVCFMKPARMIGRSTSKNVDALGIRQCVEAKPPRHDKSV